MTRREGGEITINSRQMVASHRRMGLKGFPNCRGKSCIRGMDIEDLARQKGMTREEALGEIAALFADKYLYNEKEGE